MLGEEAGLAGPRVLQRLLDRCAHRGLRPLAAVHLVLGDGPADLLHGDSEARGQQGDGLRIVVGDRLHPVDPGDDEGEVERVVRAGQRIARGCSRC
ncbi:MAG: hypothetical protein FJ125_17355 [Deltaproteobacteria bacterium]|nr:hypothetical protein [Deltaproteobacteria bacterium]